MVTQLRKRLKHTIKIYLKYILLILVLIKMDGTNQEQVQQCKSYLIDQIPAGNDHQILLKLFLYDDTIKSSI